jgi:hypothetical protein
MRKASVATWLVLTGCFLVASAPAQADGGTALRFGQGPGERSEGPCILYLVPGKTPEPTLDPLTTTNGGMSWKALASIGAVMLLVAVGLGLAIGLVDDRLTRQDEEAVEPDPGGLDSTRLGLP